MKYKILAPWASSILGATLPDKTINKLITLTDEILESENKERWGHQLAGQIDSEYNIPLESVPVDVLEALHAFTNIYLEHQYQLSIPAMPLNFKTKINFMWFNDMKSGEYNPPHIHKTVISSVLFLKVPEFQPRDIPNKKQVDGVLQFIGRVGTPDFHFQKNIIAVNPHVGDIYSFPSSMMHLVSPFEASSSRRSISFNSDFVDING